MAAAKTKPEPPRPHVPIYMGDKGYMLEGKMYFTPEGGGPVLVHPDHVDIITAKMEEDDAKAGRESQFAPTDPLATATRDELIKELVRLRGGQSGQLDIVATPDGTSGVPAETAPPAADPPVVDNPFSNK